METESSFIVGTLAAMCVTWIGVVQHRYPAKRYRKTLAALEYFESTPEQGIMEAMTKDLNAVAHKWTLLRLARNEPGRYTMAQYQRIEDQLQFLEPYYEALAHQMRIGAGLNLGAIVETKR